MKYNNYKLIIGFVSIMILTGSCKKFLDVNTNPNGPEKVDPAIYLASIQSNFALGIQFDSRGLGPYVQNFVHTTGTNAWNIHGYASGSDFAGELWRNVYWRGGQNLLDLINQARDEKKWDVLGVGLALQAWGWQMLTDYHGEIILRDAYNPNLNQFPYTTQPEIYMVVDSLCREALVELSKTGDAVGSTNFPRFDLIYKGDRSKWIKFVYGLMAINYHHLSRKANYKADSVISFVDKSFASNADDANVPFLGTSSADANFFGPIRSNMHVYAQSEFIVRLMDSTGFGVKDPRRTVMLTASGDGKYRGLKPGTSLTSTTSATATGIKNLWGTTATLTATTAQGKFLYQNKSPFPLMTYPMLQFIKAEAAFINNNKTMALDAFTKGVNAHMDWVRNGTSGVNQFVFEPNPANLTAYTAERNAYMANTTAIPTDPNLLTLSHIHLQKYIALWGWGFIETWSDLRKFDYSNTVFTGFQLPDPTILFTDNAGAYAYRVRPRYNSEYIWNIDALTAIGGFDLNYHTKKMWFHQP